MEGGEGFGLGALAVGAVGVGRGVAITLCPVVVVRVKEGVGQLLGFEGGDWAVVGIFGGEGV